MFLFQKAMNMVYSLRNNVDNYRTKGENKDYLKEWLIKNSKSTIEKYLEFERSDFKKPVKFTREPFSAYRFAN